MKKTYKKKNKEKLNRKISFSFISALLSLFICIVCMTGTSWAWFADYATVKVENVVSSDEFPSKEESSSVEEENQLEEGKDISTENDNSISEEDLYCICKEKCSDDSINQTCEVCVNDLSACIGIPEEILEPSIEAADSETYHSAEAEPLVITTESQEKIDE